MLGAISIAEESTSFGGVTHPPENGGLGFNFKWNMGWMNDTLSYMQKDPVYRQYHHNQMTFGMIYQYSENFVLPLSHDEVVHGKCSLLGKMPGDAWQKFANLRAYYGYMWGIRARNCYLWVTNLLKGVNGIIKKAWIGSYWMKVLAVDGISAYNNLVKDLNKIYRENAPLFELDSDPQGFDWLVVDDAQNSVFAFERQSREGERVIVISNFTPVPRHDYRIGVNVAGKYHEILNTDSAFYEGSNVGNWGEVESEAIPSHNRENSISVTIPPLATVYLKLKDE